MKFPKNNPRGFGRIFKMIKFTDRQKELIEKGILSLATCDLENRPNTVAVSYCRVVEGNKILITDNYMNKTRINLLMNNKVALAIWTSDQKEGYQFKGIAEYLISGKWKKAVNEDPNNKGEAHKAAVLVTVEEIWDLANPRLIARK